MKKVLNKTGGGGKGDVIIKGEGTEGGRQGVKKLRNHELLSHCSMFKLQLCSSSNPWFTCIVIPRFYSALIPSILIPSALIPSMLIPSILIPCILILSILIPSILIPCILIPSILIPSIQIPSILIPSILIPSILITSILFP